MARALDLGFEALGDLEGRGFEGFDFAADEADRRDERLRGLGARLVGLQVDVQLLAVVEHAGDAGNELLAVFDRGGSRRGVSCPSRR